MNLKKKKNLIARTLGVGADKVILDSSSLVEIKQAITRQDIRELFSQGIIRLKEPKGRRVAVKRGRRRFGSVRMKVKKSKRNYIIKTRKTRRMNELGRSKMQGPKSGSEVSKTRREAK